MVLLGASFVGKTSLLQRCLHNSFNEAHVSTLGCAYGERRIMVDSDNSRCVGTLLAIICFSLDDEVRNLEANCVTF